MALLPESSALTEASPDSISELFNRDVELITEEELGKLILELRANRERYESVEKSKPARNDDKISARATKEVIQRMKTLDIKSLPSRRI